MTLRAPISTRTDKLFPDTTLFRSARPVRDFVLRGWRAAAAQARGDDRVADPSGRIQGQILAADRHDAGEAAAFDPHQRQAWRGRSHEIARDRKQCRRALSYARRDLARDARPT